MSVRWQGNLCACYQCTQKKDTKSCRKIWLTVSNISHVELIMNWDVPSAIIHIELNLVSWFAMYINHRHFGSRREFCFSSYYAPWFAKVKVLVFNDGVVFLIRVFPLYTMLATLAFLYCFLKKYVRYRNFHMYEFKVPWEMPIYIETDSIPNCFQFISIRSYTKMSMLSTLCIMDQLDCLFRDKLIIVRILRRLMIIEGIWKCFSDR